MYNTCDNPLLKYGALFNVAIQHEVRYDSDKFMNEINLSTFTVKFVANFILHLERQT